ncbi:hypothetical protein HMPREF9080_00189 [Cardiobacterium valvarum F0432]|uniref:Uncharacterized protein n=1 Tax=Cardiobacterium valvarum F0432 TaxID=797473 RepID=G9ZBR2_9GAMM|nr:hypothetical protein HMPREF9080_00189 [Cardiobacterium valvarum F0432]
MRLVSVAVLASNGLVLRYREYSLYLPIYRAFPLDFEINTTIPGNKPGKISLFRYNARFFHRRLF